MLREIRFTVTGEVRKPKSGDWFLNTKNFPICATQDFDVSRFPILKMEVVEELDDKTNLAPICVRK
ncbi:MAG: hypothetical protein C0399_00390 [Syntrophus sp. (in: bacteria)]|nr:hypothetical protein [Syntrophus sp. (in: bacteria)]